MHNKPTTWMPIYWGDYTRDTGHLNATMHGAYMMLIKHYWCTGKPLPDDDAQLWRIATCDSLSQWKKIKAIIAAFFLIADGLWRHSRIERELANSTAMTEAKAEAGKKGAAKRWHGHSAVNGTAMAEPSVRQWQNDAPSPSPSQQEQNSVPSERPGGGFLDLKTEVFNRGKAYLVANGVPISQAGSIIGRWRKTHDDATILNAFLAAETECAAAPIEFITGVLRHAAGKTKRPAPFDAVLAAASGIVDRSP
jgi:uncharacterized protein YdaU (DUF1376 family)